MIELDLRAGVQVKFVPDRKNPHPFGLLALADEIKWIETLPPNWDSYGAQPLDDRAVLPAIEIAIEGLRRCAQPRALPLVDGGLGLRWSSPSSELEVDIEPDGLCSAVYENLETGEIVEIEGTRELDAVFALVRRFAGA